MASKGTLRVVLLWHMHQPYYRDLVTGEYRMPWVRMHALKDYYGMVKLLDEFPKVHQNFNLVPSLVAQIQDYVAGTAKDPFLDVAAKPAAELTPEDKRFALSYLFQANVTNLIGRYPRYKELWEKYHHSGANAERAAALFSTRDYADLQVLSQLAWFDEYFLREADVAALVQKGEDFDRDDQLFVLEKQKQILAAVLPAYAEAAKRGSAELSATPYYHPILPLICDTNQGAVSEPNLPLPKRRFRHPEDAEEQIRRAVEFHEKIFGVKPQGMWPSEGSVSEEALAIAAHNGICWMATDEGVLGRTLGVSFERTREGQLINGSAERLYNIYKYQKAGTEMHMVFRDHHISDLIGFVYAGMGASDASSHLMETIKKSAEPLISAGKDAVVSIILDGENAWESYHESGREFLRQFYDRLEKEPGVEAVTISEAIAKHKPGTFGQLKSLVPGSWINANFNVWIGAPEDNRSWEYLQAAREFYEQAERASEPQKQLAYEELLIAEGSDWNWWYGPEHHSANDRDFDDLYRKHLSNMYQALGATPPEYLAQPISIGETKATVTPQTAYIHPRIDGRTAGYFDWMGAAMYAADHHTSAMHGKQFLLDAIYAGVDEENLYVRLDFSDGQLTGEIEAIMSLAVSRPGRDAKPYRLRIHTNERQIVDWVLGDGDGSEPIATSADPKNIVAVLGGLLEMKIPLVLINAKLGSTLKVRFSLWRDRLPLDALPLVGWVELNVTEEESLEGNTYNYSPQS